MNTYNNKKTIPLASFLLVLGACLCLGLPQSAAAQSTIEYLLVGGGGGGGDGEFFAGAGGGGGEVATSTISEEAGIIDINIGTGGAGATTLRTNGVKGGNTSLDHINLGIISAGGGGGGGSRQAGGADAVGGGGGAGSQAADSGGVSSGTAGDGGGSTGFDDYAAGGGGAFGDGVDAVSGKSGDGGDGVDSSITGTTVGYGGGGGGGARSFDNSQRGFGTDGGGTGGSQNLANTAGEDGKGGGGAGGANNEIGTDGGDGVAIFRWTTADYTTNCTADGGVETTDGTETVCTFTTDGSLTINNKIIQGVHWNATDWTLYDTLTIDNTQVDDDLTDFPVYVDLSDLSSQFWSTTPSAADRVGADIRITTDAGTPVELARELVSASSTTETGELHFKANSISSTTDTTFRIYYNGTTTADYRKSNTYGAENVWSDYEYVSHDGGIDSTSGGNNGTAINGATIGDVAGQVGLATDLDGVNDYIDVGQVLPNISSGAITVSLWAKTADAGFARILNEWAGSGNVSYLAIADGNGTGDGQLAFEYRNASGQFNRTATGSYINDDVWHRIVLILDTATNEIISYLDGIEVLSTTNSNISAGDFTFESTNSRLYIGAEADATDFFDGSVDSIQYYLNKPSAARVSAEYTNQSTTTDFYTTTPVTPVAATSTLANHPDGQVANAFSFKNKTQAPGFAFAISSSSEEMTVTNLILTVTGIDESVSTSSLQNIKLYQDNNDDAEFDGGDTLLDNAGTFTITNSTGTIQFTSDFVVATTSTSYLMTFDTNAITSDEALVIDLLPKDITATDNVSSQSVLTNGSVDSVQHIRNSSGSSGSSGNAISSIGGEAPVGRTEETGGESSGGGGSTDVPDGENIAPDPNFFAPSSTGDPDNEWSNPQNAFASDGSRTSGAAAAVQSYGGFGFAIPAGNEIIGIELKLDASDPLFNGKTVNLALSGDAGSSYTANKNSGALPQTDTIAIYGGSTDLWGRIWTPEEFNAANFRFRLTAGNEGFDSDVSVDAFEVRVYHQASGGSSGGGGSI